MGSAMFTGVSALQANQRSLDVIASNIANVNTTGYRGSRVLFQDLFSQTLVGPRQPVARFGGVNPQQVGLGVRIASIDVNHTQGSLFSTGIASDLAIQGNGFFILSEGGREGFVYTRDGSFGIDQTGALTNPANGAIVQGFLADANGFIDDSQPIQDIVVPIGTQSLVRATTEVTFAGNLNSTTPGPTEIAGDPDLTPQNGSFERTVRVFDTLGTAREITFTFTKTDNTNEWTWTADDANPGTTVTGAGTMQFSPTGDLISVSSDTISMAFDPPPAPAEPVDPFEFTLDFTQLTQLASDSDASVVSQNGFPRGVLELFSISQDGVINGVFSNGLTLTLGQVGIATFPNNGGLERIGDNAFRDTPSSGAPQIGLSGTGNRGRVSGGVLERSNVDLGVEFSNLIITQRAFQANARTITTSDTLLQEVVNLIR
jgi:flagellar hook protein FlgE